MGATGRVRYRDETRANAWAGVRRIAMWRLDRRRPLAWQAEWLIVGPRWSHR